MDKLPVKSNPSCPRVSVMPQVFFALILGIGFLFYCVSSEHHQDRLTRIRQAKLLARAVGIQDIQQLSTTISDLKSPVYIRLKNNLYNTALMIEPKPRISILGQQFGGEMFYYLDSNQDDSAESNKPGEPYKNATNELVNSFISPNTFIKYSQNTDEKHVAATYMPLADPHTGNTAAILKIESEYDFISLAVNASAVPIISTIALLLIILSRAHFFNIFRNNNKCCIKSTRILEMATAASIGLVITFAGVYAAHKHESRSHSKHFFHLAQYRINNIIEEIDHITELELSGLVNFIKSNPDINSETLENYSTYISNHSTMCIWQYAPAIDAANTSSAQKTISQATGTAFSIWPQSTGHTQRHYPVLFCNQHKSSRLYGYDYSQNSDLASAISRAEKFKLPSVGQTTNMLPGYEGINLIPICAPVYSNKQPDKIEGMLIALLQTDELLLQSGYINNENNVEIEILTNGNNNKLKTLASTFTSGSDNHVKQQHIKGFVYPFDKAFAIEAKPEKSDSFLMDSIFCHLVGIVCLLITAATTIILGLTVNRREELQNTIAQRTHDLQQSQQRTQTILESVQCGIIIVDAKTHEILQANPAAQEMLGASKDNITGQICHKYICPAEIGNCPYTDLKQNVDRSERIALSADGKEIPILKTIVPITLDDRECLLELFVDITEHQRNKDKLQQQANQQSVLAEFGHMALSISSLDDLFMACTEAVSQICDKGIVELFQYNPQRKTLLRTSITGFGTNAESTVLASDDPHKLPGYCLRNNSIVITEDFNKEKRFTVHESLEDYSIASAMAIKIPGHSHPLGVLGVYYHHPYKFEKSQIDFFSTIANILSAAMETRLMQDNLEHRVRQRTTDVQRLLKQKDGFVNRLGHDLKTPLTPLMSLLPIIMQKCDDEKLLKMLHLSHESVRNINTLVDKTLQLANLNNLDTSLNMTKTDISQIVSDTLRAMECMFNDHEIAVVNNVKLPVFVMADEAEIREVLFNILDNAVQFNKSPGTIMVDHHCSKEYLTLSITDSGIGMTFEQASRAFEEYYKADDSRHNRNASGLGLGICKRIIDLHGGNIWAKSAGIDRGSTFFFTLPLAYTANEDDEPENSLDNILLDNVGIS